MARSVEDILKIQIGGLVIQLADSIAKGEALAEELIKFQKSESDKPTDIGKDKK